MSWWIWYLLGLITLPTLAIASFIILYLYFAVKQTIEDLKDRTLLPGYSWWHWLYIYPRCFWSILCEPFCRKK